MSYDPHGLPARGGNPSRPRHPAGASARAHSAAASELGELLDIEAGLGEVLLVAQHANTRDDLLLDIDAGLRAIRLSGSKPRRLPGGDSAVADWLTSLDDVHRLVLRAHPLIVALTLVVRMNVLMPAARVLDADIEARMIARRAGAVLDELRRPQPDRVLRAAAGELAQALAHLLEPMLAEAPESESAREMWRVRDLTADLLHAIDGDKIPDPVGLDPAILDQDLATAQHRALAPRLADSLDRARHDFVSADLREADLRLLPLAGVRWSAATRWPSLEWQSQALLDSDEVADGVWVIRGGSTSVTIQMR